MRFVPVDGHCMVIATLILSHENGIDNNLNNMIYKPDDEYLRFHNNLFE